MGGAQARRRGSPDNPSAHGHGGTVGTGAGYCHSLAAWRVKERLRWVRQAKTRQGARWRITRFINYASDLAGDGDLLESVRKALQTLRIHAERVVRRWTSTYTNARLEGMNGLFQAARARARGYRNDQTFITMIYMIGSPIGAVFKST